MNVLQHDSHRIGDWFKRYITVLHALGSFLKRVRTVSCYAAISGCLRHGTRGISRLVVPAGSGSSLSIPARSRLLWNGKNPGIAFGLPAKKLSCWKSFGTCSFTSWKRLPLTLSCLPGTDGKTGSYDSIEYLGIRKVMHVPAPESCRSPVQRMASR